MNVIEWYFAFYPRRWTPFDIFGHVEAFGYTADSVWVFFDPQRTRTRLTITYMHDEVQQQIAARFASANLILKIPASDQKSAIPIGPPMTCATACAHLLGFRAFTPAGLQAKLLAAGAETVHGTIRHRPGRIAGKPASAGRGQDRQPESAAAAGRWADL